MEKACIALLMETDMKANINWESDTEKGLIFINAIIMKEILKMDYLMEEVGTFMPMEILM